MNSGQMLLTICALALFGTTVFSVNRNTLNNGTITKYISFQDFLEHWLQNERSYRDTVQPPHKDKIWNVDAYFNRLVNYLYRDLINNIIPGNSKKRKHLRWNIFGCYLIKLAKEHGENLPAIITDTYKDDLFSRYSLKLIESLNQDHINSEEDPVQAFFGPLFWKVLG